MTYPNFDEIKASLRKNQAVVIRGFGTFKLVKKKSRTVKMPNGKTVSVAAKTQVKFVPSKKLLS